MAEIQATPKRQNRRGVAPWRMLRALIARRRGSDRTGGERRKNEADRDNYRESDHPHEYFAEGWLAGSIADRRHRYRLGRFQGSEPRNVDLCPEGRATGSASARGPVHRLREPTVSRRTPTPHRQAALVVHVTNRKNAPFPFFHMTRGTTALLIRPRKREVRSGLAGLKRPNLTAQH
jgi:hypothetical protein